MTENEEGETSTCESQFRAFFVNKDPRKKGSHQDPIECRAKKQRNFRRSPWQITLEKIVLITYDG